MAEPVDSRASIAGAVVLLVLGTAIWGVGLLSRAWFAGLFVFVGWYAFHSLYHRPGRRGLAQNGILLVASLGVCLVVAELTLRVWNRQTARSAAFAHYFQSWPQRPNIYRFVPHVHATVDAYGDIANMSGAPAGAHTHPVEFQTDARGFRNQPGADQQPLDLVVLGDSYAAGLSVTQSKSWSRLLARNHDLAVYNMGVPGGPWNSYANWSFTGPELTVKPGAVMLLMLFEGNDLYDYYGPMDLTKLPRMTPWLRVHYRTSEFRRGAVIPDMLHRAIVGAGTERTVLVRRSVDDEDVLYLGSYAERVLATREQLAQAFNLGNMQQVISHLQAAADARDMRLVVVALPSKERVYLWHLTQQPAWSEPQGAQDSPFAGLVGDYCRERQIEVLDMTPVLRQAAENHYTFSGGLLWWPEDTHWNEGGNAFIAEYLGRYLYGHSPAGPSPIPGLPDSPPEPAAP